MFARFKKGGKKTAKKEESVVQTQTTEVEAVSGARSTSDANSIYTTASNASRDAFATPSPFQNTLLKSSFAFDISALPSVPAARKRKFKSARLQQGEYDEKPWALEKNPRKKWEKILFWGGIVLGIAIGGFICFLAYDQFPNLEYCLVLEDDFNSIDSNTWNFEIQRGGFGTGSFEWTTNDPQNAYTDADGLHIVPTLTVNATNITLAQLTNNYVLNLTTASTCTAKDNPDCSIRSNSTSGAIINPVRSARLTTKGKKSIKYGRVEVVAKMPVGDWLWPAIWMMPQDSAYGAWPASGEIDIAESRGNAGVGYPDGRDSIISALHWGPIPAVDAFWRTSGKHNLRRADYSQKFHTYGLEWNENYLFTYIDTRLLQVFFVRFKGENMWDRGAFGQAIVNHSALFDPWSQTQQDNTPFDQDFFLILNLAVGGTNGFFPDGVGGKPWADASIAAPAAFWNSKSQWLPTWGEGDAKGLTVQSVKMWEEGRAAANLQLARGFVFDSSVTISVLEQLNE